MRAFEGEPVAVALHAAGVHTLGRSSKYHRPRGAFCLDGHCASCYAAHRRPAEPSRVRRAGARGPALRAPERLPQRRGRSADGGRLAVPRGHGPPHAHDGQPRRATRSSSSSCARWAARARCPRRRPRLPRARATRRSTSASWARAPRGSRRRAPSPRRRPGARVAALRRAGDAGRLAARAAGRRARAPRRSRRRPSGAGVRVVARRDRPRLLSRGRRDVRPRARPACSPSRRRTACCACRRAASCTRRAGTIRTCRSSTTIGPGSSRRAPAAGSRFTGACAPCPGASA